MEEVAQHAVSVVKENISKEESDSAVRQFLIDQRNNILVYLPAELQLGNVLDDNTLDDRTNKMEGPVSGFMHRVENLLSKGDESKYP